MATVEDGPLLGEWARGNRTMAEVEDSKKPRPPPALCPNLHRWNPFDGRFWRYHLGTDYLVASWLFVLASAFWVGMEADDIATERVHRFAVAFNHDCTLVCAVLFLLGSCYFVFMSYPEELARMMVQLSHEDITKLTWTQRYFTGSDMLVATWFFAVSTLPFVVFGLYAVIVEPRSDIGYGYLFASSVSFGALGIWVLASMPENMAQNNGTGSTYAYDKVWSKKGCCGGCLEATMKKYAHSDMLLGMWVFFLMSLALLPYAVFVCVAWPSEVYSWLDLVMVVSFALGSGLMCFASYPENFGSSVFFDTLVCAKGAKAKERV